MTDQRSSTATYRPSIDYGARPAGTKPDGPAPSFRETVGASFKLGQADQMGDDEQAVINAYGPLVTELNRRGSPVSRYVFAARGNGNPVNEYAVWRDIAAVRARDPQAFPDLPSDRKAFRAKVGAEYRDGLTRAADVSERGGLLGNLVGGFGAAMTDPINVGTAFVTGGGSTLARRIVAEAVTNAGTELLQQPFVAMQRAKTDRSLSVGEAALNVASAGAFGGAVPIAGALGKRVLTPAGKAVQDLITRVGADRLTPEERGAARTLQAEDDALQTNPYGPGGAERHLRRLDAEKSAMASGKPLPPAVPAARFDYQSYANRIGVAESGGKWDVQAKTSSAYGFYQLTRGTFLRYAKDVPSLAALPDDLKWGRRTNPAVQEAVFRALTTDNRAALTRAGVPETAGNLYLLHFAGGPGGTKILRAAPDTPIERLMSAKAIEANPWLRGKSADDLIEWAHSKMREPRSDMPVLRRADFDPDEEGAGRWRAAQEEVEAAERALDAADAEVARSSGPPRLLDGEDDIPFDLDDPRGRTADAEERDPFAHLDDEPVEPGGRAMEEDAPAVPEEPSLQPMRNERVEPTLTADAARELEQQGLGPVSNLDFVPREGKPGVSLVDEEGHFATAVFRDAEGRAQGVVRMPLTDEARELSNEVSSYVRPEFRRQGIATKLYDRLRAEGYDVDGLSGTRDLTPDGAAFVNARRERLATRREAGERAIADQFADGPEPEAPPSGLDGYDSAGDAGALSALDSLEHDLRMLADAEPGATALNENGDVVSVADLLDGWNAEDAEIAAVRACTVPGGEG